MGTQLFQSVEDGLNKLQSGDPTDRRLAIEYLKEFINVDASVLPALQMVAKNDKNDVIRYLASEAISADRTINSASTPEINENATDHDLLVKLVKIQIEQNETLLEIKKHTGCIYSYLVGSLLLGILLALLYYLGLIRNF